MSKTTILRSGWKTAAWECLNKPERTARLTDNKQKLTDQQTARIAYASRDWLTSNAASR